MVLENKKLHLDTLAIMVITHGFKEPTQVIAQRLSGYYDSEFLQCVLRATEDTPKPDCLKIYLTENYQEGELK